jgi:hypothetical protein
VHERQNAGDCLVRIHDHVKQAAGWVRRWGPFSTLENFRWDEDGNDPPPSPAATACTTTSPFER